jgi:hypothetical protein
MSSFKHKPTKLKYRSDATTLNELHKNFLSELDQNVQSLPEKKQKLDNLNYQLKFNNELDIHERSKIMNVINNLELEISQCDNNSRYLEYVSKAGDLLVNYYNITSGIYYGSVEDSEHLEFTSPPPVVDVNSSNSLNTATKHVSFNDDEESAYDDQIDESTEFFIESAPSKSDKLQQLHDISKQSRKIKRPVKKRRIIQPTTSVKSIFNFIETQPQTLESSGINQQEGGEDMILNRATLQHKYLMLTNKAYACGKIKAEKVIYCPECLELKGQKIEKVSLQSEGCFVCKECGHTENVIMESEIPSHKELANEKQKYPYKKINHLKEKLNQFQSKESADVPEEICSIVRLDLRKRGIDPLRCAPPTVRLILKKHKLTAWYEHLQQIYCKVSGNKPITLPSEIEETIINMFQIMQEPFNRHCPTHRSNFLSYSYVLNKIFKILDMHEHSKYFGLLKSKEKLREQDAIWSKICKDLNWRFYSSF